MEYKIYESLKEFLLKFNHPLQKIEFYKSLEDAYSNIDLSLNKEWCYEQKDIMLVALIDNTVDNYLTITVENNNVTSIIANTTDLAWAINNL